MESKREINDRGRWCAPILAICLAFALSADPAQAFIYWSGGGAGETIGTEEIVLGAGVLDAIRGTTEVVDGVSLGDIFRILISDPEEFSVSTLFTQPGTNNFDTQIFLFDSNGLGIAANDDAADSAQSFLSSDAAPLSSLVAGVYYVLIEGAGRYPVDAAGNLIFSNFLSGADADGVYGANSLAGVFTALTGNSSQGGDYSLVFTGAEFIPVPEPSTVALLGAAALMLCLVWRKRDAATSK